MERDHFAAIAFVYIRRLSEIATTASLLMTYFVIASTLTLLPALVLWEPIEDLMVWLYLLGVGVFGVIYQYLQTKAYTHAPASKVSMTSYLGVVFGGLARMADLAGGARSLGLLWGFADHWRGRSCSF